MFRKFESLSPVENFGRTRQFSRCSALSSRQTNGSCLSSPIFRDRADATDPPGENATARSRRRLLSRRGVDTRFAGSFRRIVSWHRRRDSAKDSAVCLHLSAKRDRKRISKARVSGIFVMDVIVLCWMSSYHLYGMVLHIYEDVQSEFNFKVTRCVSRYSCL